MQIVKFHKKEFLKSIGLDSENFTIQIQNNYIVIQPKFKREVIK